MILKDGTEKLGGSMLMKQSAKKKRIRGGEGGREKCKRQKKRDVSLRMIGP